MRRKSKITQDRGSEAKFQNLIEGSVQGIFICGEDFRIYFANRSAAKIFGFPTPEEMIGYDANLFVPPFDRENSKKRARSLLDNRDIQHEGVLSGIRKDGQEFWADRISRKIEWDGKPAIQVTVVDITAQVLAEKKLHEHEELLKTVVNNVPHTIFVKDLNGKFLMMNEAGAKNHGRDQQEFFNKTTGEILEISQSEKDVLDEQDRTVIRTKSRLHVPEMKFTRSGKEQKWRNVYKTPIFDENGEVTGIVGIAEDITERMQAESKLKASELKYRNLIEGSIQGIAIIQNLILTFSNKALAKMYGYDSPEELIGRDTLEMFVAPNERKRIKAMHFSRLKGGRVPDRYEFQGVRKDGSLVWLESLARTIEWNGEPAAQVTYIDITERKKAEQDLLSNQNLIKAVFDAIPFSIFVKDREHRYLIGNKTWLEKRGIGSDEVKGFSTWDLPLLTEEQKRELIEIDKKVFKTGKRVDRHEFAVKDSNGELRIYNQNKVPLPDHEGNIIGLVAVSMDVTEITEARNELKANKNLLQTIFDNIPIGIQVRNRNNEKLFVNKARAERVGMTPDEFLKSPESHPNYWEEEAIEEIEQVNRKVLDEGITWEMTRLRKFKNFQDRWIKSIRVPLKDRQGNITGLIDVSEDITDLKIAEEKQKQTEGLMQTVVKNVPIIIWGVDREGLMTLSEGKGLDRQGFKSKDLVGLSIYEIYKDYPDFLSNVRRAFSGESFTAINETMGSVFERWFEPIRDGAGEVNGLIGVSIDITDRTNLENQLRQAQKMEAVGQLAGGVAHDFNNMLQIIHGYSELALENSRKGEIEKFQSSLNKVLGAAQSASELTAQLLAFSRQSVLKLKMLNLNDVVEKLMKMLTRLIGEDVNLQVLPGKEKLVVHGDRGKLEQVVMNLCVNARDAMPTGGDLVIEITSFISDEAFHKNNDWAKPGKYAVVSISDTGHGIPKENLDQIFEPFFTTKKVDKGTGLGLSVVLGIVQQHEGHISVCSEPDVGSTFKVFLPVSEDQIESTKLLDPQPIVGGKETILVAEDEPEVLELIVDMLEEMGYTIFTAKDGADACDVFDAHCDAFDLALLDVIMPNMGGRAVYDHIHQSKPSLPVLFSTGYTANAIDSEFLLKTGMKLLQKPYSPTTLFKAIREVLDVNQ